MIRSPFQHLSRIWCGLNEKIAANLGSNQTSRKNNIDAEQRLRPYQTKKKLGRSKLCVKGAKVGMLAEPAL